MLCKSVSHYTELSERYIHLQMDAGQTAVKKEDRSFKDMFAVA